MDTNANVSTNQEVTPTVPAVEPTPADLSSDELKAKLDAIRNGPAETKDNPKTALPPADPKTETTEKTPEAQLREFQKFNGRLTTELGLARSENARLHKELLSLKAKTTVAEPDPDREAKNQKFIEDPLGMLDEELEKREKAKADQDEANKAEYKSNYEAVCTALPQGMNIDDIIPDMFAIALEDGVPEDVVMEFAKNPWKQDPRTVIALAKRAIAERKLRDLESAKTPKDKPKVGKPFNTLTASSGQSGRDAAPTLTREQVAELSDEELKEYKRQLTKRA